MPGSDASRAEKGHDAEIGYASSGHGGGGGGGAAPQGTTSVAVGTSLYAKMRRLAGGEFGVERRGIERVPEDERTDTNLSQVGTVWLSANMVVSSLAIGVLAYPVFGLSFLASALTIVFLNLLGILPVCFFSTFGPRFGLRQMVLSRFFFGYNGVKLIAIFNILACLGWSAVNVIVGSQLLHAVGGGRLPGYGGILIIAAATLLICVFGYRLVHAYERWSWAPSFVIFLVVLGAFARSGDFVPGRGDDDPPISPAAEAGAVLSFAASVFGFATGWTSYAADYAVYQPAGRRRAAVFAWTFGGLFVPLCFTELLGAAVGSAVRAGSAYGDAYDESAVGGLLWQVLWPRVGEGFAYFCLVVLALSIVANNCPNIYSVALTLQVLASPAESRVPRPVWTVAGTAVYVAVAIPGYDHFEDSLEAFMLVIAYWLAIYEGVSLTEHFVFRRGIGGYVPDDYQTPSKLPPGFAAITAFLCGVAGAVLGMSQEWFSGPIGKLAGGDIGFELAFGFTAVSYTVLRAVEKSYCKR
ncbi:purine-cytosine permease [Biscogniauxia mediterranea]|nr:purine-cytosine permease [Biscogniauxia mediterranea]